MDNREGQTPGFIDVAVNYGSALGLVTKVLQGIEAAARFLPGGAANFDVDFAGTTLRIRESFTLPTLPLGLGYLQNIGLDMGFDVDVLSRKLHFAVGVGSDDDPFDDRVIAAWEKLSTNMTAELAGVDV